MAAFLEGMHAQAFPSFGSERMGAPVMAFCRLDDREIRLREPVTHPDALIIQDPTLLHQVDLLSGPDIGGYLLVNTRRKYSDPSLGDTVKRVANRVRISRPVTPHVLRHSSAVTAVQRNISLPSLQRLLGLDHLGTSQIYLNLSPEEVIREFNEKWCGACSWRLEACRMFFGFGPRRGPSHEERQLCSRSLQIAEAVRVIPR